MYDIGLPIADMPRDMRCNTSNRLTNPVADPKQLVWGVLNILRRIRGHSSRSYLFPPLLERSNSVFGLEPNTMSSGYNTTDETSPTSVTAPRVTWNNNTGHQDHSNNNNTKNNNTNYDSFRRVSTASHVSHNSNIPPPLVDSLYIA